MDLVNAIARSRPLARGNEAAGPFKSLHMSALGNQPEQRAASTCDRKARKLRGSASRTAADGSRRSNPTVERVAYERCAYSS
jgi:hypothetical protein